MSRSSSVDVVNVGNARNISSSDIGASRFVVKVVFGFGNAMARNSSKEKLGFHSFCEYKHGIKALMASAMHRSGPGDDRSIYGMMDNAMHRSGTGSIRSNDG
ncbi:hypothetical protein Syun_006904 [Stephania yunnanensis]|uniref:Uncharacterized protein n=1 Tax=Stephania yunnanensis TaxID=152371 RepID=A0AAP0KYY1_9MAGN